MRILLIGINFFPEITSTGKFSGEMVHYLAANGNQVRVITAPPYYPQWKVQNPYRWYRYSREELAGADVYRAPLWVPRNPSTLTRILHLFSFAVSSFPSMIASVFYKPDIVISIAPSLLSAPASILTARLSGARSWLHIHDFELDTAVSLGLISGASLAVKLMQAFERLLLWHFDRVSTISMRMIDRLHKKGVDQDRSVLFPNWVDIKLIFPLDDSDPGIACLRKVLGIPEGKMIALYSGNIGEKQGLEVVLEAASILDNENRSDILFVICGEGAARTELEFKAKGLGNVLFAPLQPTGKLNILLNMAAMHLLPQRADAADLVMPSKLSGMLASGRPVIVTANPGTELAEVVSACGVVVPPEDAEALAAAIGDLADSSERRGMFGSRGRQWVETHWSCETVLPMFLEELKKLTGTL